MSVLRRVMPSELARRGREPVDAATLDAARAMLAEIARRGDDAVVALGRRFDECGGWVRPLERRELRDAADSLGPDERGLLERTADRIRTFAAAQKECVRDLDVPICGGVAGHTFLPVDTAGCYAPGGRYPLPSSVLMTVIPARAAGVRRVVVASPRPTRVVLAAAYIAGADALLPLGGVQAIGAMAYGCVGMPACDMIVGPGNRWVTAAKSIVSSFVGIDMLAGPSELVVLADGSADAGMIAADLLAQAEHDVDAVAVLVTASRAIAGATDEELSRQLETLPTRETASAALRNGFVCIARDDDEAVAVCNQLAPEHLEVMHERAGALACRLTTCGALFVGGGAAEVLGDYGAGPNHTLPTGGTARFRAGLSVFTFLRARTWMRVDDVARAGGMVRDAAALARLESLEGHARSALRRMGGAEH